MTTSIYLNPETWDMAVDAAGNIAVCSEPYRVAQDAATAILTWAGEVLYDTTLGIRYREDILGQSPSPVLIKTACVNAALTVPGVVSAVVYLTELSPRNIGGQVQVTDASGTVSVANF